jgi:RsiW-degrading membrane proteinase PrsW (M82 family)
MKVPNAVTILIIFLLVFGFFAWFASDFIAKSAKGEHTWGVIAGVLLIGLFVGAVIGFATQGEQENDRSASDTNSL